MKSCCVIAFLLFSNVGCNIPTAPSVAVNEPSVELKPVVLEDDDPAQHFADDTKYKILDPGFHYAEPDGTDIGVKNGETWYGLFKSGDIMSLRRCRVIVKRVRNESNNAGLKVSVVGKEQPIYLLKGPKFRDGDVPVFFCPQCDSATYDDQKPEGGLLNEQFSQKHRINGNEFTFRAEEAVSSDADSTWRGWVLVIESPKGSQIIGGKWLEFIGDIDLDGKPDILISTQTDAAVRPVLYLSSEARPSKLLQAVAEMGGIWVD